MRSLDDHRSEVAPAQFGVPSATAAANQSAARETPLSRDRVGVLLGEWQSKEVAIASSFHECRGLAREQREDLYQETTVALLARSYVSEEHLKYALRDGIKKRALRLHRDQARRREIEEENAPGMRLNAEAIADRDAPEAVTIANQDRLIATEFLAELTAEEQRIFGLLVEGHKYRAIARALQIPVTEARRAERACGRKRERFQLLYETGRLCGYRARTIQALRDGDETSEQLAALAFAHLESCPHCRAEHRTNAAQLRLRFRDEAASLLPPVLLGRFGWVSRHADKVRGLLDWLGIDRTGALAGGIRERVAALALGSGTVAKLTAGLVAISVLAAGAVASHAGSHHRRRSPRESTSSRAATKMSGSTPPAFMRVAQPGWEAPKRRRQRAHHRSDHRPTPSSAQQHEPSGFGYLGVPNQPQQEARARIASAAAQQGGPFSP